MGVGNTAIGTFSLFSVSTGNFNTAVGAGALDLNTGDSNTATGAGALLFNTTGTENTAVGVDALGLNTTGEFNAAVGAFALYNNTIGVSNTAMGWNTLAGNTTGNSNTAIGINALVANSTGLENTAVGGAALGSNTNGANNAALGHFALEENTTGAGNTAVGDSALEVNTTGSNNIALGQNAGVNLSTGNFNIDIGNSGNTGEAQTIRIGAQGLKTTTYIAGIFGQLVDPATGTAAFVDTNGKLGTMVSAWRFKHDIQPMDKASEAILALKPVTFHYKSDAKNTSCFGLIAEDVAAVNPDLIVRDKEGKPYSVRYDAVNAMLLNEFLKEHQTVRELKKQVAELTSGLQKLSAQLELNKPAPQTVLNNH